MAQRPSLLALIVTVSLLPGAAQAAPILFDLEAETPTPLAGPGITTLVLSSGGVTMTLTREGGAAFGVLHHGGGAFPPEFGSRSLTPFFDTRNLAYLATLSVPTYFFGLDFGDLGPDADTMTIEAYSGPNQTGSLLESKTFHYPGLSFPSFETISIGGPTPALSLRFIGGFGDPSTFSSVYVDNIRLETERLPEPALLVLVATGVAGVAFRRRRQ